MMVVRAAMMVALTFCIATAWAQNRNQAQQFQEAIHLMETRGNYPAAIRLFEEVAKGPDRNLAARSLLYVGLCYEKLGKERAQKAYQRLIREFADQREVVAQARARLSALRPTASPAYRSAVTVRQVWAGSDAITIGAPSPDGRYLSYVDRETGDLALRELATGRMRRLTNYVSSAERASLSIFSPDGKQVAYAWSKSGFSELRLIRIEGEPGGAKPRVLYANAEIEFTAPYAWSPDGKYILAVFTRKDRTAQQVVLVGVEDGSVRVLKTIALPGGISGVNLSPDGRYIAYSSRPNADAREQDIFLLATDGSREIPLVQHPAHDFVMGWVPDGKKLLFASDRAGRLDAWIIPIAGGQPQGPPELVKHDIGDIQPIGFTRNGSFYYSLRTSTVDVYTATLDAAGKLLVPPSPVSQHFVGSSNSPDWSPDGEYLAYLARGPRLAASSVITIRSLKTGEERKLAPNLYFLYRIQWSSDGRSILVNGIDHQNRWGLFRVDTNTGEATAVMHSDELGQPVLSPDGKAVFYVRNDPTTTGRILARDLKTDEEVELYRGGHVGILALSPDGQRLAFRVVDPATRTTVLKVMPAAGGIPRELFREGSVSLHPYAWMPDGRQLIFGNRGELWRIPAEGGEPQRLELSINNLSDLRVHPDGQRIAFTAGKPGYEVWVMENLLPATQNRRTSVSRR